MTAPEYPLADRLPTIPVEAQAGRALTITIPVLGSLGSGVDVAGLTHARAQIRLGRDPETTLLHEWSDVLGNASLEGTPGGTDAAVVLSASSGDTSVWGVSWPRLTVFWDVEVEDTAEEIHPLCGVSSFVLLSEITLIS